MISIKVFSLWDNLSIWTPMYMYMCYILYMCYIQFFLIGQWTRYPPQSTALQSIKKQRKFVADCSPPGSSVHEIFQVRILEWLPFSFQEDLPNPVIEPESPASPALQAGSSPAEPSGEARRASNQLFHFHKARSSEHQPLACISVSLLTDLNL